MQEVKIKTADLLSILKENREKHQQLYKDAAEGFKVEARKKLEKALKSLENGSMPDSISFVKPQDHTEEYDDAIRMLELSVNDELTLRASEFKQYVQDSWISTQEINMMRNFALSSSNAKLYM